MSVDLTAFNWRKLVLKSTLPANAKYLCLYLSTWMNENQDVAWPSMSRISGETGLAKPTVRKYIEILAIEGWLICKRNARNWVSDGGSQMHNEYWISVPNGVVKAIADDFQRGANSLPPIDKGGQTDNQRGVNSEQKGGKELTPNNNRITKNSNRARFSPPTPSEVSDYGKQIGFNIDGEHFVSYYQARGWRLKGGTKMACWKSAVQTWRSNEKKKNGAAAQAWEGID